MRWTLAGSLGDLSAPLCLAALAWLGLGWRAAFLLSGAMAVLFALSLWRQPYPDSQLPSDPSRGRPRFIDTLLSAVRNRRLRPWLLGVLLCDFMDEILIAFGALHLRDSLGVGIEARALILACFTGGGAIGLLAAERLLRRIRPLTLLSVACVTAIVLYPAWLSASTPVGSGLLFFLLGTVTAIHYPVAKAQVYRLMPGRSGTVNAVLTVVGAVHLAIPIALGWVADTAGLVTCLAVLLIQPLGLLAIALRQRGQGSDG